ncbi:MAG: hypothetical protein COB15_01545 [Flavobacteriales bacterium]|nr:MAG: hypothetical protein COB15_01545 [Flavobacteriales bacterium]
MYYLKLIIIFIVTTFLGGCVKEELTSNENSEGFYGEFVNVSLMDTLAKADSVIIILYDEFKVETIRIRFDIDNNQTSSNATLNGVGTFTTFGFNTLVVDNNAQLIFNEGNDEYPLGSYFYNYHGFRLKIKGIDNVSDLSIGLGQAQLNFPANYGVFYGASGTSGINQFYHYQVGPIAFFDLISYY